MTNLLLIAGNGRNAGKTTLACRIIEHLSKNISVTGLKISPHFHNFNESEVLIRSEHFIVIDEKQNSTKDSSLMLNAGADKVLFVMVKQEHLHEALIQIYNLIANAIIVCESGGLREFVEPGLFLFVKRTGYEIVKKHLINYSPIIVNNNGSDFDLEIEKIEIKNHQFILFQ